MSPSHWITLAAAGLLLAGAVVAELIDRMSTKDERPAGATADRSDS